MAEALAKVAGALVEVRDTPTLSQRIVDELRTMFETLGVMLCRVDPQTQNLRAVAVSGDVGPEYDAHVVFAAGMGTPGLAVSEPRPVVLPDVLGDARVRLSPEMRAVISRAPFRAVLAVPVSFTVRSSARSACWIAEGGRSRTMKRGFFRPSRTRRPWPLKMRACTRRPSGSERKQSRRTEQRTCSSRRFRTSFGRC
jgi:hypothetical protein